MNRQQFPYLHCPSGSVYRWLSLGALLLLLAGCAREEGLGEDFWEKYDDITDWVTLRLELTPEQEEKVLPILEQNFQRKKAMLKSYGFLSGATPHLSEQEVEEIDAKMIAIRAETRAKLVPLLAPDQLKSLKQIQREYHQDFRERLDGLMDG
ncbi:hypothetical protein AWR36_012235 [Microbulbifer flavimaris]|uniref:Periplasmic heavy metal sensor n=2 Tax=Microbulbiferaceae TaxID=1706373 RepID=A0ABX4HXA8_9GAMM|nr:hypothetical protein AVO43_12200 [Microbulbifer sp. ZGT114]PCO04760.1 hypothetical protein AWR36_012235 [Microbulbifer flavimaris]